MAFATVHHWGDPIAGLRGCRARGFAGVVVFTCDTSDQNWRRRFWLTRDYLPEVAASRVGLATELASAIGARMEPVLIPWDCADHFFEAVRADPRHTWTRTFVAEYRCGPESGRTPSRGQCGASVMISRLGRWAERNRDLLDLEAAELGLRLLVT